MPWAVCETSSSEGDWDQEHFLCSLSLEQLKMGTSQMESREGPGGPGDMKLAMSQQRDITAKANRLLY